MSSRIRILNLVVIAAGLMVIVAGSAYAMSQVTRAVPATVAVQLAQGLVAELSLGPFQDPVDGATGVKISISRVYEASTNDDVATLLSSFQAKISYDGSCVNILEVRSIDFTASAVNIDNSLGITTFDGVASPASTPSDLNHIVARLVGSNQVSCSVTVELNSLMDRNGNLIFAPDTSLQNLRRGDSRADGVINIADSLFIAQYLAGSRPACGTVMDTTCLHSVNAASVQYDGAFDQTDLADALMNTMFLIGFRDARFDVVPNKPSDTISINPNVQHQTIVGWEFTGGIGIRDFPNDFQRWRDELIDRAVNELGINRTRLESHREFHKVETTNDNNDPFAINMAGFDFTEFDKKIDLIVLPMKQRLQANGEDLYINLNPVGIADNADLFHHDPEEYAEYVLAHFLHMESKYGFVPDSVELSLEPNEFNTFDQDPIKYGLALVATANRLESNGFANVDFYGPSLSNMRDTIGFFDLMITVPGVLDHLDVIAYHRYSTQSLSLLTRITDRARTYGLATAQLERIGADYHVLHEDLKVGNNVAWQQYALGYPTGDNGAQYLTIDNPTSPNPTVTMASRTKFLRQYFKYVRKGAVRVDANSVDSKFDPVAFINANGKYVVVVKASGGGNFSVNGLPAGTYGVKHTTGSPYDVDHADASIGSGGSLTTNIPEGGVMSIYEK